MNIQTLLGKVLTSVTSTDDEIIFNTKDTTYKLCHEQECCESVRIESIVGDLSDLVGHPILLAEEVSNTEWEGDERMRWTFYKLATIKGYVDIRWFGRSNGYYSERVDFVEIDEQGYVVWEDE